MNKVLIALLSGIVVGILVAPDKGSVTREKLVDGFNDLADRFEGIKEQFRPQQDIDVVEVDIAMPKMTSEI